MSERKFEISATVTLESMAEQLTYMDRDGLIALIKAVDEQMQDWEFTLELCKHFAKLRNKHAEETEGDADGT